MPITINGNGTITGLSVGGLPNGIVDTDTLANNAVTSAKSVLDEGKVVQFKAFNTFTAVEFNSGDALTGLAGSITPTSSSNKIFVLANQWVWSDTGSSETRYGPALWLQRSTNATAYNNGDWSNLSDSGAKTWGWNNSNSNNSESFELMAPFMQYDNPNTTNLVWYRMKATRFTANTSWVKCQDASRGSFMYLMEIAA
tara:strand:+ start:472 stop:1065 length:594 start_codon:yes stop_codon:yes gene_type:complete